MIYFLALIPATALTVAGYVALYLSARSEGALRAFGKYLGFWAFTLAGLVILGAIFAAAHGHRAHGFGPHGMHGMHRGLFQPWSEEGYPPPPPGAHPVRPGEEGAGAPTAPAPAGSGGDSAGPAQY